MAVNRRFVCTLLGAWLGAAVCVDFVATMNFSAVDRFIADPGTPEAKGWIKDMGTRAIRPFLRRNAAEVNATLFENWEWTELLVLGSFFVLILLEGNPHRLVLILVPSMIAIVVLQRFLLTPQIGSLGRDMDSLPVSVPPGDPTVARFWAFHGFYSGFEIFKLLLGAGVAARLMIHRSREEGTGQPDRRRVEGTAPGGTERRVRRRRTSDRDDD